MLLAPPPATTAARRCQWHRSSSDSEPCRAACGRSSGGAPTDFGPVAPIPAPPSRWIVRRPNAEVCGGPVPCGGREEVTDARINSRDTEHAIRALSWTSPASAARPPRPKSAASRAPTMFGRTLPMLRRFRVCLQLDDIATPALATLQPPSHLNPLRCSDATTSPRARARARACARGNLTARPTRRRRPAAPQPEFTPQ